MIGLRKERVSNKLAYNRPEFTEDATLRPKSAYAFCTYWSGLTVDSVGHSPFGCWRLMMSLQPRLIGSGLSYFATSRHMTAQAVFTTVEVSLSTHSPVTHA